MTKNDILNELASMGLEAEYRNSISVMLDEYAHSIVDGTIRDMQIVFKNGLEEYKTILGWTEWINNGGE